MGLSFEEDELILIVTPSLSSSPGPRICPQRSSNDFPTWGQQEFRMEIGFIFQVSILNLLSPLSLNVCFAPGRYVFLPRVSQFLPNVISDETGGLWAGY